MERPYKQKKVVFKDNIWVCPTCAEKHIIMTASLHKHCSTCGHPLIIHSERYMDETGRSQRRITSIEEYHPNKLRYMASICAHAGRKKDKELMISTNTDTDEKKERKTGVGPGPRSGTAIHQSYVDKISKLNKVLEIRQTRLAERFELQKRIIMEQTEAEQSAIKNKQKHREVKKE